MQKCDPTSGEAMWSDSDVEARDLPMTELRCGRTVHRLWHATKSALRRLSLHSATVWNNARAIYVLARRCKKTMCLKKLVRLTPRTPFADAPGGLDDFAGEAKRSACHVCGARPHIASPLIALWLAPAMPLSRGYSLASTPAALAGAAPCTSSKRRDTEEATACLRRRLRLRLPLLCEVKMSLLVRSKPPWQLKEHHMKEHLSRLSPGLVPRATRGWRARPSGVLPLPFQDLSIEPDLSCFQRVQSNLSELLHSK